MKQLYSANLTISPTHHEHLQKCYIKN